MITTEKIFKKLEDIDYSIDLKQDDVLSPVQEFYNNSKIFITGATGFLGHLLLEKLMRSCPVSTIYLLVRPKKGKEMNTRLEEMFDDPVFQRMKNHCPKFREKIVGIEGDCAKLNLGLSAQDLELLTNEVDIVFHVAATVRFNEKLQTAVAINIRATQDLLRIARKMPKLRSFVHVSTVYCNCVHSTIEEKIYPSALNSNLLISITETMPDEILENITPGLIGKYPNTYTFTKQIAEAVVKQESEELPVGIYRPAIVISTYKEPVRGWINNIYGPTGAVVGTGVGLLRVLHCDGQTNANIVPADMCVNGLIVTACEIGKTFEKARRDHLIYDIPVCTFESSNDKPITWDLFVKLALIYGAYTPVKKAVWYTSLTMVKSYAQYLVMIFLLHTIPGYIFDGILLCSGKSARMTKAYEKIHKFSSVLSYFGINYWNIKSDNLQRIIRTMTDRDKKIFFCDLKQLDWGEFLQTYLAGGRIYLIKDSMESLPRAKQINNRLYWAHQTVKAILILLLLWSILFLYHRFL